MKLFGSSRKGQYVKSRSKAKSKNQYTVSNPQIAEAAQQTAVAQKPTPKGPLVWWKSLALPLKILMIFAVIMVAAVIAIAIWWKLNVKPPETSTSTTTSVASTKTTTVTKIDAQTGEEYEVEVYEDEEEAFQTPTRVVTVVDEDTGEEYEYEVPVSKKEGLYNILIVGTDGDGGRTDTIMIASLDTTTHSVALMSIPRDTYINANYSVPKINSAYGAGGMGESGIAALENQLAKMLGFEVDGYVMVDLDGFVEIVDLIGGVEFDVPMNMYYSDPTQDLYINLSAGLQVLDGAHAIQLVRYRSGYASADIQRTSVQQDFLRAFAKQCLQFSNVDKITEMAEIFTNYVTTDLTVGNIVYFATELLQCDFDEMYTVTLPGEAVTVNSVSYYALYANQVLQIVNAYFNPYDTDITLSDVSIRTASSSSSSSSSAGTSTGVSSSQSGSTAVQTERSEQTETDDVADAVPSGTDLSTNAAEGGGEEDTSSQDVTDAEQSGGNVASTDTGAEQEGSSESDAGASSSTVSESVVTSADALPSE